MKQNQPVEMINGCKVALLPEGVTKEEYACLLANEFTKQNLDDAFVVMDLCRLLYQHATWCEHLPRVRPYYAVKCNNEPGLLATMVAMGLGFDCASKKEIECITSLGVGPERIVYANPCKPKSHVRYATQKGVDLMTFDNDAELYKIKEINPNARMILRIAVSDPSALCQLNLKFGCDPVEKAPSLLKLAALLDIDVVGISFHVGSGCRDPSAFAEAIGHARRLFDLGTELGYNMTVLDIGGGYPGYDSQEITFPQIASVINTALEQHFPVGCGTDIIAEPGRFYAASTTVEVCNVVAKSQVDANKITGQESDSQEKAFMYYLNDGVYGSFNCIHYDHVEPVGYPIDKAKQVAPKFPCSLWGPTCDSMDCIYELTQQPVMDVGDWMMFDNMGAYTVSAFAEFNGFEKPKVVYVAGAAEWKIMQRYWKAKSWAKQDKTDPIMVVTEATTTSADPLSRKSSLVSGASTWDDDQIESDGASSGFFDDETAASDISHIFAD